MSLLTYLGCDPSLAVPVFEIHGTSDLVVPYGGNEFMTAIDDVIAFWANGNGCGEPNEYDLEDVDQTDQSTVTVNKYTNCTSGNEVWLYTVNGGGAHVAWSIFIWRYHESRLQCKRRNLDFLFRR